MSDLPELERQLAKAQERYERVIEVCAAKPLSDGMEEYWAAHAELLECERKLAAAKGEEYAVPLDFPVQWDIGAPLPHLLANDYRALLSFYLREPDPDWDGTYVTMKDPRQGSVESLALVEFKLCYSARLGVPNDEVFDGHPLAGKGLEGYTAQLVHDPF